MVKTTHFGMLTVHLIGDETIWLDIHFHNCRNVEFGEFIAGLFVHGQPCRLCMQNVIGFACKARPVLQVIFLAKFIIS